MGHISYNRKHFLSLCGIAPFLMSFISLKAYSKQNNGIKKWRRVITGVNTEGKSIIVTDGGVPENAHYGDLKKINGNVLWVEHDVPVDLHKNSETLDNYTFNLEPPQEGFSVHVLSLEPGFFGEYHQTKTIDFVFIISGKLELILEKGSTILSTGETIVQRGTNHAWRVIGSEPCMLAAVMISAIKS